MMMMNYKRICIGLLLLLVIVAQIYLGSNVVNAVETTLPTNPLETIMSPVRTTVLPEAGTVIFASAALVGVGIFGFKTVISTIKSSDHDVW